MESFISVYTNSLYLPHLCRAELPKNASLSLLEAWRPDESSKTKSLDRELLRAHDKAKDKKDRSTWGRVRAIVQPRNGAASDGATLETVASGGVTDGAASDGATLETVASGGDLEGYESYASVADEEDESRRLRRAGSWRRRSQDGCPEVARCYPREETHLTPAEAPRPPPRDEPRLAEVTPANREDSAPQVETSRQTSREEGRLSPPDVSRQVSREEGRLSPPDVSRQVSREETSRQSSREETHDGATGQVSLPRVGRASVTRRL